MTRILIIGEICIDEYIYGKCDRVCPEAAALCFHRSDTPVKQNYGMAGNVFNNIIALDKNIECFLITNNYKESPIIKRRFVDIRYNTIVFREDINDRCQKIDFNSIELDNYDYIIISDYNKGFLGIEDYKYIRQKFSKAKIFVDTKKHITKKLISYVNFIKINSSEYELNVTDSSISWNKCNLIVTNGSKGCFLLNKNGRVDFPTKEIEIRDVCGAGDTFLAGLVVEFSRSKSLDKSVEYANAMAGEVVKKFGVCTI
jgi:bifunctional ADP-heptose synthase (sugar kinase/adenylyltransferase)